MTERQIQDGFAIWLTERKLPFLWSRMDKRATINKGWPDFSVFFMSRCLFIETKTAAGRLSEDQKRTIQHIQFSGNKVEVCRSVSECVEACHNILLEPTKRAGESPQGVGWPLKEQFKNLKQAVEAAGKDNGHIPGNGSELPLPSDRANLYIADWQKTPWVCRRSATGPDELLHKAEPIDLQTLPRK